MLFKNKYSSTDLPSFFVLLCVFFLMWEHSGADKIYTKLKGIKRTNYSKKMKEPICFVFFLNSLQNLEDATKMVII